ncbi:MAG: sensor domain-containing protein [Clostridia bacterium]|nr:sensor domain-containing protein [Clostridia bacterium]
MEESKKPLQNFFNNFFKVAAQSRTYANIFYLLLAFPLGIFYFIFFVTGFSLGVGLVPIFIGLPLIMFMFYISKYFMAFERTLARQFLGTEIPPSDMTEAPANGFWKRFKAQVFDLKAWKSLIFLIIKFPAGIFSFVVVVTLLSISLALISAPITYSAIIQSINIDIFQYDIFYYLAPDYFSSFEKSLIYMVVGFFLTFIFLHVINLVAYISGKLVAFMSLEWN